jgi:hypothetical protein
MKIGFNYGRLPSCALGAAFLLLVELVPSALWAQPISARVEPASTNASLGSAITLCLEATGTGPFTYQWNKNGINLPDQTNQCLTLTNLTQADGGSYRASVRNVTGALASEEGLVIITVNVVAGADPFGSGTMLAAVTNSVRGPNFAATREAGEPLHLGLNTSNSVWYTWRAPATGIVTFDTRGSTFDTVLAVYVGSDFTRLTFVTGDDDSGDFHTSRASWNAQAGLDYHVVIDGVTGETGTYLCNWNLEITGALLPVFTTHPRSRSVPPGGTVTFSSAAFDPRLVLDFQWFHNGNLMAGETSSNLTLVNVQPAQLGRYRVAVTNSVGRVAFSTTAELEIGPVPEITSKDKIAEISTGGGGGGAGPGDGDGGAGLALSSVSGGTFSLAAGTIINQRFFNGGTTDRCEPAHCGVSGGASRWFQMAAMADGVCTVDTQGSDVDTVLAIYLQNFSICTNLYEPLVDCNNDVFGTCEQILGSTAPRVRTSRLSFFAPAGSIYRAVVDTVGGVRGTNLQFHVRFDPPGAVAAATIPVDTTTNCLLQMRGSSVALQVATNLVMPGSTFQWQVDGRRIAGAARDRLLLPFLGYSDAGRYSVAVQSGSTRLVLPGANVVVLDPCHDAGGGGEGRFNLFGTASERIFLETTTTLNTTSSWQSLGPIIPTNVPTLWDSSTGSRRFYRALRLP